MAVKLGDKVACEELRERLRLEDVVTVLQRNRLRWYGHVLRKDDSEWVKKCMDFVVEGVRPRGRPKRTWKEVVQGDIKSLKLTKEDALIIRGNEEDLFIYLFIYEFTVVKMTIKYKKEHNRHKSKCNCKTSRIVHIRENSLNCGVQSAKLSILFVNCHC